MWEGRGVVRKEERGIHVKERKYLYAKVILLSFQINGSPLRFASTQTQNNLLKTIYSHPKTSHII